MSREPGKTRRQFTPDEKATILRRHLANKVPVSVLCDEYHIQPSLFCLWQRQVLNNLGDAFQDGRRAGGWSSGRRASATGGASAVIRMSGPLGDVSLM